MGKKSGKGKEKKLKRKEELDKITEVLQCVKAANEVDDPLQELKAFQKFNRNGLNVQLACKKITSMSAEEVEECFKMVKDNMHALYEQSSWGWNEKGKMEEMTDDNVRYLMCYDDNGNMIAMCHFRFDTDEDVEVLYCYEIQLLKAARGKGLGKFLMQTLELMAVRAKMRKIMVTVFKANERAVKFFRENLKYIVDDTSPTYEDPMHPEDYDYEIYSKSFTRKPANAT